MHDTLYAFVCVCTKACNVPSKGQVEVRVQFSSVCPFTSWYIFILNVLISVELIHLSNGKLRGKVVTIRVVGSGMVAGINWKAFDVLQNYFDVL